MTRKHYQRIADTLAGQYALAAKLGDPGVRANVRHGVENIVASLADVMAQDNPRFDRRAFYLAALGRETLR